MLSPVQIAYVALGLLPSPEPQGELDDKKVDLTKFPLLQMSLANGKQIEIFKVNAIKQYLVHSNEKSLFLTLAELIHFINTPAIQNQIMKITLRNMRDSQSPNTIETLYECKDKEWDGGYCVNSKDRDHKTFPLLVDTKEIKKVLSEVGINDTQNDDAYVIPPKKIVEYALLMLPTPKHKISRDMSLEELKDLYPHLSLYFSDGSDWYIFKTNTDEMYLVASSGSEEKVSFYAMNESKILSFVSHISPMITLISMVNQLDSEDRASSKNLYACLPDENESEYDGGPCFATRAGAGKTINKFMRKRLQEKRHVRSQIKSELSHLPSFGSFPGGIEFQKAQQRFARNTKVTQEPDSKRK